MLKKDPLHMWHHHLQRGESCLAELQQPVLSASCLGAVGHLLWPDFPSWEGMPKLCAKITFSPLHCSCSVRRANEGRKQLSSESVLKFLIVWNVAHFLVIQSITKLCLRFFIWKTGSWINGSAIYQELKKPKENNKSRRESKRSIFLGEKKVVEQSKLRGQL